MLRKLIAASAVMVTVLILSSSFDAVSGVAPPCKACRISRSSGLIPFLVRFFIGIAFDVSFSLSRPTIAHMGQDLVKNNFDTFATKMLEPSLDGS